VQDVGFVALSESLCALAEHVECGVFMLQNYVNSVWLSDIIFQLVENLLLVEDINYISRLRTPICKLGKILFYEGVESHKHSSLIGQDMSTCKVPEWWVRIVVDALDVFVAYLV